MRPDGGSKCARLRVAVGVFGDPDVRIVTLDRRSKKRFAAAAVASIWAGTIAGYASAALDAPHLQLQNDPEPGARQIANPPHSPL
jgi:hypothetical protein